MIEGRTLFENFGKAIGADGLRLDDSGYCCLAIDDTVLNFELQPSFAEFLVYAPVGALPARQDEAYLHRLHQANYASLLAGTGAIGIDREGKTIMFVERVPLRGLDAPGFVQTVEGILRRVREWQRLIFSGGLLDPTPGDDVAQFATPWMMRV